MGFAAWGGWKQPASQTCGERGGAGWPWRFPGRMALSYTSALLRIACFPS